MKIKMIKSKENRKFLKGLRDRTLTVNGESIFDYDFGKFRDILEKTLLRTEGMVHDLMKDELTPEEKMILYQVGIDLPKKVSNGALDITSFEEYRGVLNSAKDLFESEKKEELELYSITRKYTDFVRRIANERYSDIHGRN